MANLERSFEKSPYHYCGLCFRRRHLSDLIWQEGVLVCVETSWCNDTDGLVGSRDAQIARVLRTPGQEMEPDRKLQSPAAASANGIEEIIL